MSPVIRGTIRMAIASLKNSRWRSGLTIFGVVVAIVPVLTILGIGEGVKRQITDQINTLGTDLITIRSGSLDNSANPVQQFTSLQGYNSSSPLTFKDYQVVKDIDSVDLVAPLSVIPGKVSINEKDMQHSTVVATTETLPKLLKQNIQHGDFFKDKQYGQNAAVVGRGAAENLFGEGVPLGRTFDFRGQTFVIRGVLQRSSSTPLSSMADLNNAIIISYENAKNLTGQAPPLYEIVARAHKTSDNMTAIKTITKRLQDTHGGERDFSVITQTENLRVVNRVLSLLTALVSGVAGIALLVSGISIMNIMLVSVTERMHEIGIRKAIGATKRQILGQFMTEAILLSTTGGAIGIVISFVIAYILRVTTPLQPVITWEATLLVFLLSIIVGVVFGSVPALKAAQKDPIEALRHE